LSGSRLFYTSLKFYLISAAAHHTISVNFNNINELPEKISNEINRLIYELDNSYKNKTYLKNMKLV